MFFSLQLFKTVMCGRVVVNVHITRGNIHENITVSQYRQNAPEIYLSSASYN